MEHRPPRPAASAEPARWLTDRVDLWHGDWVTGMVGDGFEAYARLFHPLDYQPSSLTWAQVARANGRAMHPSAEWEQISSPAPFRLEDAPRGRSRPGDPIWGELDTWALDALCSILARHTSTPEQCYFAVWEGCGLLHGPAATAVAYFAPDGVVPEPEPIKAAPAEWQLDLSGPTFSLPGRDNYYLFEGRVREAVQIGYWNDERSFDPQSPHFFWPADHAWCVATEVDYDSTFIGGTRPLVDELCGSDVLEVLEIAPDAPSQDRLNL